MNNKYKKKLIQRPLNANIFVIFSIVFTKTRNLFFLALALFLLFSSSNNFHIIDFISSSTRDYAVWLYSKLPSVKLDSLYSWFYTMEEYERLKAENMALRSENAGMRIRLKDYEIVASSDYFKSRSAHYKTILARIVMHNSDTFGDVMSIDVGSADGVKKNAAVVLDGSLVAKVISVGEYHSIVLPIHSVASKVAAISLSDRVRCILVGGDETLHPMYFPSDVELEEEDVFITSGDDDLPYGLQIGFVTQSGGVKQASDLRNAEYVKIVMKR